MNNVIEHFNSLENYITLSAVIIVLVVLLLLFE